MKFDSLPVQQFSDSFEEKGVRIRGNGDLGSFGLSGIHLADSGTSFAQKLIFRTGQEFYPVSIKIVGLGTKLERGGDFVPYENLKIRAFRNGTRVFWDRFYAGDAGEVSYFRLPEAVGPVDRLVISSMMPDDPSDCTTAPCGNFNIDNVRLARSAPLGPTEATAPVPVPLPAPGLLLLGALVAFGLAARRRRAVPR
ncbi:MAG: hypothetical protein AAGD12_06365 [Pseudomonadota bacterium]